MKQDRIHRKMYKIFIVNVVNDTKNISEELIRIFRKIFYFHLIRLFLLLHLPLYLNIKGT